MHVWFISGNQVSKMDLMKLFLINAYKFNFYLHKYPKVSKNLKSFRNSWNIPILIKSHDIMFVFKLKIRENCSQNIKHAKIILITKYTVYVWEYK